MLEVWKIIVISICAVLVIVISAGALYRVMKKQKPQKEVHVPDDIEEVKIEAVEDQMVKYGEPFAIVTPLQTALSPPRHTPAKADLPPVHDVPPRLIFSLTPLHERQTPHSTISSHNTAFKTPSPPIQDVWRGPTPIWTQYPGNKT